VKAAIYARYSSENQRPESIADQVASCRRLAAERGYEVPDERVYADEAASGSLSDRSGLTALRAAAEQGMFQVVLVDDLSRLARNALLMLSVLEELRFLGVRVVSVADGLDTEDEESAVGIQIRGIFNELQLTDLRKKTFRGQLGQKQRGFVVGEATYGYRSVPVGRVRLDKKGRPRPEGYRMTVEPSEAAIVLRIFRSFADGLSGTAILRALNKEGVPARRSGRGHWAPASVHRVLRNEKYIGIWTWNKTRSRRDPRTGHRRKFSKPQADWVVNVDEGLRIVPQELWEAVQTRIATVRGTWPGGEGKRGFETQKGSRVKHYPRELLSGSMVCGVCGSAVGKVSGKGGGYYGCLSAVRGRCTNKVLTRRNLAEKIILSIVRERLTSKQAVQYLLGRVEDELHRLADAVPEKVKLGQAELERERRRLANLMEVAAEGQGSRTLGGAILETEGRVGTLKANLEVLRRKREVTVTVPPESWIRDRITKFQDLLERRPEKSALLIRRLLGPIRLVPASIKTGRKYLRAETNLGVLSLIEKKPGSGPLGAT
jgi:site-specific DNA recombinase